MTAAEWETPTNLWLGQQVAVIGAAASADAYQAALTAQGVPVLRLDPTEMTLAGLRAAHAELEHQ